MMNRPRLGTFQRNVLWQIIGSGAQAVLSGLVLLLLGRSLHPQGFGVFSIVMGYIYVANALFEPRMQDLAAKQFWDFEDRGAQPHHNPYFLDFLALEVLGKLLPCLGLILGSGLLSRFGHLPPGSAMLISTAAIGWYLAKLGNGLSTGVLRVLGRSDLLAYCATGELALRLTLLLGVSLMSGLTVEMGVAITCAAAVVSNAAQGAIALKRFASFKSSIGGWRARSALLRLTENRALILSNIGLSASDLMGKDLDITLISPILPAYQVGIYKMSKNIAQLVWKAIDPFSLALMPEVSRRTSLSDFAGLRRLLVRSSVGLFGLALVLSLGGYAALLLVGNVVLGPGYSEVPKLIPWMLVGLVFSAPLVWGHPLSVALNCAHVALLGSLIGSAAGLVLFVLLVPRLGIYGAAIGWVVTLALNFLFIAWVSLIVLQRRLARAAGPNVR
jgi:O-antigen/teichoic acid export membrane protein